MVYQLDIRTALPFGLGGGQAHDGSWSFLREDEPVAGPYVTSMHKPIDDYQEVIILRATTFAHLFAGLAKDNGVQFLEEGYSSRPAPCYSIFENEIRTSTRSSDGSKDHRFADVSIHILAPNSKWVNGLRELLLTDSETAVDVAMIALLIKIGRIGENVSCKFRTTLKLLG